MADLYCLRFTCLMIISSNVLGDQLSEYHAGSCGGRFEISNEKTFIQLGTVEYTNAVYDYNYNWIEVIDETYKTNEKCTFYVFSTHKQPMIVTSEYFEVENDENCSMDYMGIEDDGLETKYCGMEPLTYITSSLDNVTVTFHSDDSGQYLGFKIAIQSQKVDENSFCNNTILGDKYVSDTISNSILGTNCFYHIQAENEKYVQLTLQRIDFGCRTCAEESVIVYEGHSTHGTKLKVICSDTTPQVLPFRAHAFFIEYRKPLQNELEDAFKIKYDFVESTFPTTTPVPTTESPDVGDNGYHAGSCGGLFEISNGTTFLQLGVISESYKINESCTFHVFSTYKQPMIFTSEYFEVENHENCSYDYMGIVDDGLETKYCGMEPLTYITSSSDNVTVTFHSDGSVQYLGFKIAIQSQKVDENSFCNNTILGDKYVSDTISNSILGTNCFYKIQAENEKAVQLTLQQIDFGSRKCAEESVIVYEGHSTHGKRLKVIYSDTTPQVLPFRANSFFIEYRNRLNNEQEYAFKIKYEFVESTFQTTTHIPTTESPVVVDNDCSGRYIELHDVLLTYTPPCKEDNKHCIVVIRNKMLVKHVVQVQFECFDIEESVNCTFDQGPYMF